MCIRDRVSRDNGDSCHIVSPCFFCRIAAVENVCPALSGRPPCRWSRCRATIIVFQQAVHRYSEVEASRPYEMALAPLQRLRQVAASPTPTACLDRLRRPIACPRTTHWRTSCGQPDAAKGVALGAVAGYVRHCRQHDAHRGAAGET